MVRKGGNKPKCKLCESTISRKDSSTIHKICVWTHWWQTAKITVNCKNNSKLPKPITKKLLLFVLSCAGVSWRQCRPAFRVFFHTEPILNSIERIVSSPMSLQMFIPSRVAFNSVISKLAGLYLSRAVLHLLVFRGVLASLYEGQSVRRSVGQSLGPPLFGQRPR